MCGQAGPATVPLQYAGRHQHRRREIVGELFHPVASCVARLFVVRGWHRVPGEDVKQLVCEIEMTAAGHFTPCDQDCIQFRKTAGRPRDAGLRVHHEHQDCEFPFHHFAQTRRRDIAQGEFYRESFAGMRFLETGLPAEPKRPAHKRGAVSHLRCQIPECSDPASGSAFVRCELASLNPGVSPAEAALPDQQKRIREVFQGSTQHLACAHQFVGGYSPDARLYGRDSLSILEAEETVSPSDYSRRISGVPCQIATCGARFRNAAIQRPARRSYVASWPACNPGVPFSKLSQLTACPAKPAEAALPDQQKRIREVFQGSTQHLACAHQFVGGSPVGRAMAPRARTAKSGAEIPACAAHRAPPRPSYRRRRAPHTGRDSLSILEAEETGKAVLGELALFAQRIDACADGRLRRARWNSCTFWHATIICKPCHVCRPALGGFTSGGGWWLDEGKVTGSGGRWG